MLKNNQNTSHKNSPDQSMTSIRLKKKLFNSSHGNEKKTAKKNRSVDKQFSDLGSQSSNTRTLPTERQQMQNMNEKILTLQGQVSRLMNNNAMYQTERKYREETEESLQSFSNKKKYKFSLTEQDTGPNESQYKLSFLSEHSSHITLQQLKMYLIHTLQQLKMPVQFYDYFEQANDLDALMTLLSRIVQKIIHNKQRQWMKKQVQQQKYDQLVKQNKEHQHKQYILRSKISQLDHDYQKLIIQHKKVSEEFEIKETQLFQLQTLYEQNENAMLRLQIDLEIQKKQAKNKYIQYESEVMEKICELQKMQFIQQRMKWIVQGCEWDNQFQMTNRTLLLAEIQQWERENLKLKQRYTWVREEKEGLLQDIKHQRNHYENCNQILKEGSDKINEGLGEQLDRCRQLLQVTQKQLLKERKKSQTTQKKFQEAEENFIDLNDSFTQHVQQWLQCKEHYQTTINALRDQLKEAQQTIADYSKLLALEVAGRPLPNVF